MVVMSVFHKIIFLHLEFYSVNKIFDIFLYFLLQHVSMKKDVFVSNHVLCNALQRAGFAI